MENLSEVKSEKKNLFQKLTAARFELSKRELKKSGVVSYFALNKQTNRYEEKNFNYHELSDFMPAVTEIEYEVGLTSVVTFESQKAILGIYDSEDMERPPILFYFDMAEAGTKVGSPIQQRGAEQTYARRYLYTAAYNISETDLVDNQKNYIDEKQPATPRNFPTERREPQGRKNSRDGVEQPLKLANYTTTEDGEIIPIAEGNKKQKRPYAQILEEAEKYGVSMDKIKKYCNEKFGTVIFNNLTEDQLRIVLNKIKAK